MKKTLVLISVILLALACSCGLCSNSNAESVELQILATSDLHGKFYTWDYALNAEDKSGSMLQLASAVKAMRTENTLVLDSGDVIQDNSAELFIDADCHPMILAMNEIGYDACTTGNHEYNYGLDVLKKAIASNNAEVLVGNVWDKEGQPLGKPYKIIEISGIRVGIIGMVSQNILAWDKTNLEGCTVTNPVTETRKAIEEIKDKSDLLIGLMHFGLGSEYGKPGVRELAEACPEFDVIIAAHDHQLVSNEEINGVLVVENKNAAQSLAKITLEVEKTNGKWEVKNKKSESVLIKDYESDPELEQKLKPYHLEAVKNSESVVGKLEGGNLAPENEIYCIPEAQLQDTALMDLINNVQMYYTDAPVSVAALTRTDSQLLEGNIRQCDISNIYKYSNTLYKMRMTGKQLKIFMEYTANYYRQYKEGDLTIAFNPDIRSYNYDVFSGVCYEIDISKPAGSRITNLTWMDGTPVLDEDSFEIAVNNYRANSQLMTSGVVFEEDNLPEIIEIDVHGGDIGDIRALICDYIVNVKGGVIRPEVDYNWKITGADWDVALHEKAVEQVNSGLVSIPSSADGRTVNVRAVTVSDLK